MLLASFSAAAQDKVIKANGDTINVKVVKIDDDNIFYKYEGEDLEYQISKDNISEITFKSGRKETYNSSATNATPAESPENAAPEPPANVDTTRVAQEEVPINNVFTVTNNDMSVDNKIFIYNLTGKELQISVHGTNYKTGHSDLLDHITLSNKQDKRRLASKVKRGTLDHYTNFTFTIDSGKQKKFYSTIDDRDLIVFVWEGEFIYGLELESLANNAIIVENKSIRPLFYRLKAIDENGREILCKETTGVYLTNPTWTKSFEIKGEFKKVEIVTFEPFKMESTIDTWSRCVVKATNEAATQQDE